jgi:hypothetical protein
MLGNSQTCSTFTSNIYSSLMGKHFPAHQLQLILLLILSLHETGNSCLHGSYLPGIKGSSPHHKSLPVDPTLSQFNYAQTVSQDPL